MSGVRLSPGSPGVERVSRAPGSPRPLARRCLFGPVDGQSLAREAARYRAEMEEESRTRWNFDFSTDRPLDGALQWEEAGPDTPEFYRRPVHRKPTKKRSSPGKFPRMITHNPNSVKCGGKLPGIWPAMQLDGDV
ncbi:hypothetical protein AB205_0051780, partial [Aquarana catesbeiana]